MTHAEGKTAAITLDQWIALNDEIAALARAQVPLEQGLYELGRDMPGRLGKIAILLAGRLERGELLSEVLAEHSGQIPAVYRAAVEAGVRSGRLSGALESITASARRVSEARRLILGSTIYPLFLLLLAWELFVFSAAVLAPRVAPVLTGFGSPAAGLTSRLAAWGQWAGYWGPGVPLVILLAGGTWWLRSNRALLMNPRSAGFLLGWVPWTGSILRSASNATLAEVLALLVENNVPLHEGLVLAAESVGDPKMLAAARTTADAIQRGQQPSRETVGKTFPPLLEWLLLAGREREALLSALRVAADTYRRRAARQAELAQVLLPAGLTVAIGGTVTLLYGIMMFAPWIVLLKSLARL